MQIAKVRWISQPRPDYIILVIHLYGGRSVDSQYILFGQFYVPFPQVIGYLVLEVISLGLLIRLIPYQYI